MRRPVFLWSVDCTALIVVTCGPGFVGRRTWRGLRDGDLGRLRAPAPVRRAANPLSGLFGAEDNAAGRRWGGRSPPRAGSPTPADEDAAPIAGPLDERNEGERTNDLSTSLASDHSRPRTPSTAHPAFAALRCGVVVRTPPGCPPRGIRPPDSAGLRLHLSSACL